MNKFWSVALVVLAVNAAGLRVAVADHGRDNDRDRDRDGDRGRVVLKATLAGGNEVPPISTEASATFRAIIHRDDSITFRLTFSNLSDNITQSHIHFAPKGVAGGIMIFLCGPPAATGPTGWQLCPQGTSGIVEGTIGAENVVAIATQGINAGDLAAALRAVGDGAGYANVHSVRFPGGEVRGQVIVQGDLDDD